MAACGCAGPEFEAQDQPKCFAYMHSGKPASRKEVGRATWAFLHTMAAYYPESPTTEQQQDMTSFLRTLPKVYPCGYCGEKTAEEIDMNPPRVDTQTNLAQWMCEVHNEVNTRLNKPLFDCSTVSQRWKYA